MKNNQLKLFQRIRKDQKEFFITKILDDKIFIREIFIKNQEKIDLGKELIIDKNEII